MFNRWVFVVSLLLLFIPACKKSNSNQAAVYKILHEGMESMSRMTSRSSDIIYASLEERSHEPQYSEKTRFWFRKAERIRNYASRMVFSLEQLKQELYEKMDKGKDAEYFYFESSYDPVRTVMIEQKKAEILYDNLQEFRVDLLTVDPAILHEFSQSLVLIKSNSDFSQTKKESFPSDYFSSIPPAEAVILLDQFENNVKNAENKVLAFCHDQTIRDFIDYDTFFSAIIAQNIQYVRPGDNIEITAGIGQFQTKGHLQIFVNGKKIEPGVDGAAHYRFSAISQTGKHFVPVRIDFTDQEGKKQTIKKNVEYTVAK